MTTNDAADAGPVERPVRPVSGVVLDRNGWPTLIVRGNEEAHVLHAGASYLYTQAALDAAVAAERERLKAALQEADAIMAHDDAATEWRERWADLWPNAKLTG